MDDAMKLLPCPFCGDDDPEITGEYGWVWIACTTGSDCAGRGPDSDDEASAIEAWNRRASPPAREEAPDEGAVDDLAKRIRAALSDEQPLTGEACQHGWDRAVCVMKTCDNPYAFEPLMEEAATFLEALRNRTSEPEAGAVDPSYLGVLVAPASRVGAVFVPKDEPIPLLDGRGSVTPVYDGPQNVTRGPATADKLPDDVRRLVLAARAVAFGPDCGRNAVIDALDKASEAFADRVSWDDEPDAALNEGGE